jgi:CHAD domain-containing protein
MGYCLKLREPLADGLKRIFREEVHSALELCRHPAKQRAVTVHEVRKHLKKLRAALRLTKDEVGKNRWATEDRCLREIGRLVSDLRDAHVRLQTLIQLRDDADQQFARIEELLSMERESFSAAFSGWQKQAIPKLERAGERLSKWPLAGITWKQICGVVAKTYRRGQNRLAKALKKHDPESFHVWRMSVKELWYQLRVLRPLNRLVLEEIASDAKTLGELLGRAHDFAFLLARLDKERGDPALYDELVQLQKLIRKRGKRLHRDALELGRRFYAEPAKAFAKRISIFIDKRKAKS